MNKNGSIGLMLHGHKYYLKHKTSFRERWICTRHTSRNCTASIIVIDDNIVSEKCDHNH